MQESLVVGLDEAGRGPVLGPMIVAAVRATQGQLTILRQNGLKDSKQLSPAKRQKIFKLIKRHKIAFKYQVIPPRRLDAQGLTRVTNASLITLIRALPAERVVIDAPVPPAAIAKFKDRLRRELKPLAPEIVAKNRADVTEPIVSAASVVAKYQRERRLKWLKFKYWRLGNIGSGYTSDPLTRQFLEKYYQHHRRWPKEARLTWRTLNQLENKTWTVTHRPNWSPALALSFLIIAALSLINPPTHKLPAPVLANEPETPVVTPLAEALVTKVIDGDTLTIKGGKRIRLLAIDTPEIGEPCFEEAKNRLSNLVLNKTVRLESDVRDQDIYNRDLRFLFLNGKNINLALVEEGLAVAYFFDNIKYKSEIQNAEADAIAKRVGCRWRNLP